MNYSEFSSLPRSQKITLAVIKAKQRLKNFTFISGSTWTRVMPYYVSNVTGAVYDFNPITSTLTITSAVNPNTLEIVAEYSFFFADSPVNQDVEYQARLVDIGALKLEIDSENTGIAIESDSSIKLENTDGYFDQIYDALVWENQECLFYSWSPLIPWADRKLIYRGYINTKSFSDKFVSFTIKDAFVKLREKIPFTGSRLIYGKAKNLDCASFDPVNTGFALSGLLSGLNDRDLLTGALSGTVSSSTITGMSTLFTSQLIVGDKLRIVDGLSEYSYTVSAIASDTSLTISGTVTNAFSGAIGRNASVFNNIITGVSTYFVDQVSPGDVLTIDGVKYKVASIGGDYSLTTDEQIKTAFTSLAATNLPEINYRQNNRQWNVSGHLLADHETTIDVVYSQRSFSVVDISHISDGDIIEINPYFYIVSRISGNIVTINQSALATIASGDSVVKPAIQSVSFEGQSFVHGRDFTESNLDAGCKVVFNDLAEFNAATELVSAVSFAFVNASRTVTSLSSTLDLTTLYAPRDWIKAYSGSTTSWYEILAVDTLTITLRHNYNEVRNYTGPALYRKPVYIGDDSNVLVDCMGKRSSSLDTGIWLKTASDAVKDICSYLGMSNIDETSFANAKLDAPYCLSVVYPENIGGEMPIAREIILKINKAAFGSLYSDSGFNLAYSVLNADRDETPITVKDDDIISFTTTTKNQIIQTVNTTYRLERGTDAFQSYSYSNANVSGISTELAIELCLYDAGDAEIITQRYAFFRSNSQVIVNIKGKLSLISKSLNDRVYLSLDRLFKRFGSSGNIKVGLVNMVSKDSSSVDIQVNDLGNIFSRVGSIAPNTASDYDTATELEKSLYCYICDNDTETPDVNNDESLGSNLIG